MRSFRNISLAIIVGLLPLTAWANGSGVLIGPFWLDGVRATETGEHIDTEEGRWNQVIYQYRRSGLPETNRNCPVVDTDNTNATFTVFAKTIALPGILPNTVRVFQKAQDDQIRVIVSGRLNCLKLTAYILTSARRELWIEPGQMQAELGLVSSGLQQIAGGTMDLKGSRLWIENATPFRTRQEGLEGVFDLTTWKRPLVNAKVTFAGGASGVATLTAELAHENIELHVDMSSGAATLWKAALAAPGFKFGGEALQAGLATISNPQVNSNQIEVLADKGALSLVLTRGAGAGDKLQLHSNSIEFGTEQLSFSWSKATANGRHTADEALFEALAVQDGAFQSDHSHLVEGDHALVDGALKASGLWLSSETLKGTFDWNAPDAPVLSFMMSKGDIRKLDLIVDGQWGHDFVLSGALDSNSLSVGGFKFARQFHLSFPPSHTTGDIVIPISVDAGDHGGTLEVSDGKNAVLLTAELRQFSLLGKCILSLWHLEDSHLQVEPNNLKFEFASAVATTPWLGSTKPLFAGAHLAASNPTVLSIGPRIQNGIVQVDTDVLAIGDPVLQMGKAKPFRARATLNSTAGATFAYCMKHGTLNLMRATLHATDSAFKSLDPGAVVDLGGVNLKDPDGSIEELSITLDRMANRGSVSGKNIQLAGSHVSRRREPNSPNDLAFEATPQGKFLVAKLEATPRFNADQIEFTDIKASSVQLSVTGATLAIGQVMSLDNASFSLGGDGNEIDSSLELSDTDSDVPKPITSQELHVDSLEDICKQADQNQTAPNTTRREYFANVKIAADGDLHVDGDIGGDVSVHLGNSPHISISALGLSGRTDRLDGNGNAQFSGFAGSIHSAIATDAGCAGGQLLRIPMQTVVATGGSALGITLVKGKTVAEGDFTGFAMAMASTAESECAGDWQKVVLIPAQSGWTDGICPTWSEPFRHCRWEWQTPEVSYEYRTKAVVRALTATVQMAVPHIRFGDKKAFLCNRGPANVAPIAILGGYYPEFRGNIPVVSQVANILVGVVAETAESGIATTLGNGLGGLATSLLGDPVPISCIAMAAWKDIQQ